MDGLARFRFTALFSALPWLALAATAVAFPAPALCGSSAVPQAGSALLPIPAASPAPHPAPYLGLRVALEGTGGARVLEVLANGPAAFAGVLAADRVIGVESHAVDTPADLGALLAPLVPGQKVRLLIRRGGTLLERSATLAVMPRAVAPDRTASEFLGSDLHDLKIEFGLLGRKIASWFHH
jgi:S1-C subfamily serine protease